MADPTPTAGNILVLTLHSGGHYYGEMLTGVLRTAAAAGRHVVVAETRDPGGRHGDRSFGPRFSLPLAWNRVAGVISIANSATPQYLEALREQGFPIVLASEVHDGFDGPVAMPDNAIAIDAAVQHLADHGHRRIGFVGSLDMRDFRERLSTFRDAVAARGLDCDDDLYIPADDFSQQAGAAAAARVLAHPRPPTAVITATDNNAIGLIRAVTSAGVRVPEDLAVLGFDNLEEGAHTTPSLSSVGQRFREVGGLAARLLIGTIEGREVPAGSYVPETIVMARRGSCGCREDLLGTPHSARRVPAVPSVRSPVAALLAGGRPTASQAALVETVEQLERLSLAPTLPAGDEVTLAVRRLAGLTRDAEDLQDLAADLSDHLADVVEGAADSGSGPRAVGAAEVAAALWELRAHGHRHGERRLDRSALEQEQVASAVLRSDGATLRSLAWLRETDIRSAVLALWDGPAEDGRLRVSGVHDPHGAHPYAVGDLVDVRDFPGEALAAAGDAENGDMCFVIPVASRDRSWGLLALLGRVDTTSSREPYHHMAELLFRALEGEQLEDAVRASEERYAWAVRAAQDGLWEYDLRTGHLYLSHRCRILLGLPEDGDVTHTEWMARIAPEYREGAERAMRIASGQPGTSGEVEYRLDGDAGARWVLSRGLAVPDDDGGVARMVGSVSDTTARRELEERLRHAAMYDEVTGLANRRLFLDRLAAAIAVTQRDPSASYAVIFLDLDGFKLVNDSLGHLAGDDLLRAVARRMRSQIRGVDIVARFGGDEFAVLLANPVSEDLLKVADRLQVAIARPVHLGDQDVAVTASVGIASSATGYASAEDVLRDADTAMYRSKETQRGTATVFDPGMHAQATDRLRSQSEIRTALAEEQFVVQYQPIVPLDGTEVTAFEALVRWQHPERGLLLPSAFLPAMVDSDAIVTLGRWITDEVCRQLAVWRREHSGVSVSVNVSHLEFWHDLLVPSVVEAATRHGVPASALVLEITESVIMADVDRACAIMTDLRARGFRLHVDDFGTGHSSLQTLQDFPVDTLKIDGAFVRDLAEVGRPAVILGAIVTMAAGLGLDVIAECVERSEQADLLRTMGCGNAQGWLYAQALPADEAGRVLGRPLHGDGARELSLA
ncbi:EAL domain-containing protein [Actinotalea sp. JY-7876]|uniref:EAL domain-containing protein n=1 Tax=Actinotalea sp. JY-7876 TaxID=2758442 RepID=UPI0015F3C7EF|nr:EAL domain-containing protein [Actinotalea sp. JY-7876]